MHETDEAFQILIKKTNQLRGCVIVEGIKDRKSLSALGLKNIITAKNKPLYKIVDEVAEEYRYAILLTDLDREGKKLYSVLQHQLKKNGVKVNNTLRNFLWRNTKVRQIEGLNRYIENEWT